MRTLDMKTLEGAATHYAAQFLQPDRKTPGGRFIGGKSYVMQDFKAFTYKDEFEAMMALIKGEMGKRPFAEFERLAGKTFKPRKESDFHKLLADRLAIDPDGGHIAGKIGTGDVGSRRVGSQMITVETPDSIQRRRRRELDKTHRETHEIMVPLYWKIYEGEGHERAADSGVADPLPPGTEPLSVGALTPRIGQAMAILMANAGVDVIDEGSAGGVIQGRTSPRPSQVDDAVTGTNLFTVTLSATGFGTATDAGPGALKTANSITDDSSADATGTLLYCRASSSNASDTPLNDHFEGEAGTSSADFIFNTLSIVSGSTVSMTALTITIPES